MKLASFTVNEKNLIGTIVEEYVIDLNAACALFFSGKASNPYRLANAYFPSNIKEFLGNGELSIELTKKVTSYILDKVKCGLSPSGLRGEKLVYNIKEVRLRAPVRPSKVICIGGSYLSHIFPQYKEKGVTSIDDLACLAREEKIKLNSPACFLKSPTSIIGPEDTIVIKSPYRRANGAVELGLVIGKEGKDIQEDKAFDYIVGYTVFNDVTIRDPNVRFPHDKMQDTFAPIGPWIVTKEEIKEPHNLRMILKINERKVIDSNTNEMVKYCDILSSGIPKLIKIASSIMTLEVGDIIATGSPAALPEVLESKEKDYFKDGDMVEVYIEKIGCLRNYVRMLSK